MSLRPLLPFLLSVVAGCAAKASQAPAATAVAGSVVETPAAGGDGASTTTHASNGLDAVQKALAANDCATAKRGAEKALAANPRRGDAQFYAGVADECLNDPAGAEKHYRDAIAAAPSIADAATNLTLLLLAQKRGAEAVALLRPIVAKTPNDAALQVDLGAALAATGDHAGAAAAYERALRNEATPATRLAYSEELIAIGNKPAAIATLTEGVASAGDNRDELAAFGRALAKAGDFRSAIASLDRAIALQASADLLTYRGHFHRSLHELPAARSDFEAATKMQPTFAPAFVYLGEVLEELSLREEARRAYETAVRLTGDHGPGKRAKERLGAMKK